MTHPDPPQNNAEGGRRLDGRPDPPPRSPLLLLALLCCTLAWARCERAEDPDEGTAERLAVGDRAWAEGRRGEARCAWKDVGRAEEEEPALAAMARLRLLRVSGNLGLFRHGPAADRLLLSCSEGDPDCRLAWVDRELILAELGIGGRLDTACEELQALWDLPPDGTRDVQTWTQRMMAACPAEGQAPISMARGPGTWLLALGATGASGLGAGPVLRFVHPDLGWKAARLDVEGFATTGGAASGRISLRTSGSPYLWSGAQAAVLPDALRLARAWAAPGLARGRAGIWLGPRLSWESLDDASFTSLGLLGGTTWQPGELGLFLNGELGLVGSPWAWTSAELRWRHGRLGARLVGSLVPIEVEGWRLPAWGGGEVLRAAAFREVQAPAMAGLVAEWRQPLIGPLGGVLFGEAAWAEDPHGGGGLGLRLYLPPRPLNTVRVDLGVGDLGWAVSAGWGESF